MLVPRLARPALAALLAFVIASLAFTRRAAWADPPPPEPPKSPAAAAAAAGEEPSRGSALPDLDEPKELTDLDGKPVRSVEVELVGDRWKTAPTIKSVRLGEPLSREVGRRAMRELTATNRFARVAAEAVRDGDGVILRLHAVPRRLIASIQLAGGVLDSSDTLESAEIAEGGEITSPDLALVDARIRAHYEKHGFPSAKVKIDTSDTDDPGAIVLSIEIFPGPPRLLAQRIFVVDPRLDAEIGDLKKRYKMAPPARVDEPSLADADRELVDVLRAASFFRARVHHAVVITANLAFLYVYLESGPRLVPVFENNRAFDADQLAKALVFEKPTEAKPSDLVDRLKTFYLVRGFLDVEVTVAEKGEEGAPVHYLVFTIREGEQVRVTRRVFPCLSAEFSPDLVGNEIESYLDEELPGGDALWSGDPRVVARLLGPTSGEGRRGLPVDLNPAKTYAPETYERALKHLRDLFHSKGYLNVLVGPLSIVRDECDRRSRDGECIPVRRKATVHAVCDKDAIGLPAPEPPLPEELTCHPGGPRDVRCSNEITLRIPIQLGPQTTLYDLAFEGNRAYSEQRLAKVADVDLGDPLSNEQLDAARLRVLDRYRIEGYAYAEVRYVVEPSPDRTRARARFYVTERDRVSVSGFVVKGATRTAESMVLGRLALKKGQPYRLDWARQSEERIATLGTFSSVAIALEDADVPQKQKRVVITVVEQLPQYTEARPGFSTGEGIRFAFEYGHRNIAGLAIALTLRIQLNYLFDFMILDPGVQKNYAPLNVGDRLERRDTVSITFPEIGLGPLVGLTLDGIDVRDNQRDFGITKEAVVPTVTFRPLRQIQTSLSASGELNDVSIFNEQALANTFQILRAPEGRTIALAQRAVFTYDARDNALGATRGILISTGVEHVNAFPSETGANKATDRSHFLRLTGKISGYVRLTSKGTSIALSIAGGGNLQLDSTSKTYPDRLFFQGGADSLRAFLADSVVPEDIAQSILRGDKDQNGNTLTIASVAIRGGNLSLNPRAELRVPISDPFQLGLFLDMGNLWVEPASFNLTALRYALGAGLRIATPIGPIAFDYGINLFRRPWEDFGALHFSIGLF